MFADTLLSTTGNIGKEVVIFSLVFFIFCFTDVKDV